MTPKFKAFHFYSRKTKFGHLAKKIGLVEFELLIVQLWTPFYKRI